MASNTKSDEKFCSAANCNNRHIKKQKKMFFRFPADPKICLKWLENVRRLDLKKKPIEMLHWNYVLCQDHFDQSQFTDRRRKTLIPNAVPNVLSVADLPPKTIAVTRPLPVKRKVLSQASNGRKKKESANVLQTPAFTPNVKTAPTGSKFRFVLATPKMGQGPETASRGILTPLNPQPLTQNAELYNKAVEAAIKIMQEQNKNEEVVLPTTGAGPAFKVVKVSYKLPPQETHGKNKGNGKPSEKATSKMRLKIQEVFSNFEGHDGDGPVQSINAETVSAPVEKTSTPIPPKTSYKPSAQFLKKIYRLKKNAFRPALMCTCNCDNCRTSNLRQKRLETAKKKLSEARSCIRKLKRQLQKLSERGISLGDITDAMKDKLKENVYEFVMAQLTPENDNKKARHANRYTTDIKKLVLTVYRDSPRAYRMMAEMFEIPSKGVLLQYESQMKKLLHLENEMLYGTDENGLKALFEDPLTSVQGDQVEEPHVSKKPRLKEDETSDSVDAVFEAIQVQPSNEPNNEEEFDDQPVDEMVTTVLQVEDSPVYFQDGEFVIIEGPNVTIGDSVVQVVQDSTELESFELCMNEDTQVLLPQRQLPSTITTLQRVGQVARTSCHQTNKPLVNSSRKS